MIRAVDEMKKIFMKELYTETKFQKMSMYLSKNTARYTSCVLHDKPAE